MTVHEALRFARERLARAEIPSFESEAYQLLEALLGLSRSELIVGGRERLDPQKLPKLEHWLARREKREPLQHILGRAYFYGLELKVTPEVLIPRPETEHLVELSLSFLEGRVAPRVLDIGTGSGAIALALKCGRPDTEVLASDMSRAALEVAGENARRLGLELGFALSDLLGTPEVAAFAKDADLLVSNPPYLLERDRDTLSPEVGHDPAAALFSGTDGLEHFRRLERESFRLLKPGAAFLCELDPRNVEAAYNSSSRWSRRDLARDLSQKQRFLRLIK